MNTLLAAGGYPWTVIRVKNRNEYINSLEATHMEFDRVRFTQFVAKEMKHTVPSSTNNADKRK